MKADRRGPQLTLARTCRFWLPLAGTWLMMSAEVPIMAAVIARLPAPTVNLAAFGVASTFAMIVESPIIMLLSAATTLVHDRRTMLALRRFAIAANLALTGLMLAAVAPPVFDFAARRVLDLPDEVATLSHRALAWLLPWPAAIGYRRFHQGLLIRGHRTRWVAYGTVCRLGSMALVALAGGRLLALPGAVIGGIALSTGVVIEAAVTRMLAARTVRDLLGREDPPSVADRLSRGDILSFYVPLAMTSILPMAVQPLVTFSLAHGRLPLESLAVFPVVLSFTFLFRSLGISSQEAIVALLAHRGARDRTLGRFSRLLAVSTSSALAVVASTGLAVVWFRDVSGLGPRLVELARTPLQMLAVLPAMATVLAYQRALLVHVRVTRPITVATAAEVATIAAVMIAGTSWVDVSGVAVAAVALVLGRASANVVLWAPSREARREVRAEEAVPGPDAMPARDDPGIQEPGCSPPRRQA